MNRRISSRITLALPALLMCGLLHAEDATNLLSFANALLAEKDYYRAITEYKRFLHLFPSNPEADAARYAVGLAYFRGEKWEPAIEAFRNVQATDENGECGKRAQLMIGEAAYHSGDYPAALDAFDAFARNHSSDDLSPDAAMRATQCLFLLGKTRLAQAQAVRMTEQHSTDGRIAELLQEMKDSDNLPRKSAALAGSLSAILPGAGQLYTERPRDAGISFLLNSSLIALAIIAFQNDEPVAGGILSVVELSWYAGNIYGAVNGAQKFNRSQRQRFIEKLDFKCGIMRGANESPMPTGGISIHF